ncbi:FHA domain-containing protein [Microbulbifer yueqingensis]|uniref:Inner membrane component of T3SS domain-containing protein n=1 Tax=Microbulbifer yueqingensis TaxID=658219 RepID=A0A1G9A7W0_9GAMM|nr:FHA domain-containing protein [Microbulbifer yueqingensis]SDK23436.1 Inner membrane component of T3SS domain-containing protein [Microbulbifer yueqingensis]
MLKLCDLKDARQGVWLVAPRVTIGRASTCDLTLTGETIAKLHAEVVVDGDVLTLRDLSGYGQVAVNGKPISGACRVKLNDRVTVGDCELAVVDPKVTRMQSASAGSSAVSWALRANHPAIAGRVFPVKQTSVVGRSDECDITFSLSHLSRRHARLEVRDGLLFVVDLGSANGTFLNNRRVAETRVRRGDELRFDTLSFSVVGPADDLDKTTVRPAIDLSVVQAAREKGAEGEQPGVLRAAAPPESELTRERQRFDGGPAAADTGAGGWLWLGTLLLLGLGVAGLFWARQQGLI